jgi:phosphoribosyl 1,2-cyclic phosphate phosphodiesterase
VLLTFLGTGASGGTPGSGRSQRRESSLLVDAGTRVLVDATRDLARQLRDVDHLDAVVLTHAHRDAAGGVPALRRWWSERSSRPLPLYAAPEAIEAVRRRHRRTDHLAPVAVEPGLQRSVGRLRLTAVEVPHARDRRYRTYAWRIQTQGATAVYASDVARLEPPLERLAQGAGLLAIDGAMWRRTLFSHLTIDRELPTLCRWPVEQILLTQIGRTAPPHEELERAVSDLCPKASPARDGLRIELG